ncbi:unnamed protein product [Gongylonema pulchrum]|uniref:Ubiquitin-like domain-containing protein n=1 Tax=Gongylonema pulchrum TaxID=637853 RepID=A0A183DNB1_9BILA|nr:unnamed protein product [Gongylonema pulchrum]
MRLKVKTLDRGDHQLELDDDATLGMLRKLIEEKVGVVESRQRLIFQGRPLLCNDQPLKSCGVNDGLTVHMVERPADATLPAGLRTHNCDHERHSHGTDAPQSAPRFWTTLVSGELAIVRNIIFRNTNETVVSASRGPSALPSLRFFRLFQAMVRQILSDVVRDTSEITQTEVEPQENVPGNGDLTLRIRVRCSSRFRPIDSGARTRVQFAVDCLRRSERTLQLLEV